MEATTTREGTNAAGQVAQHADDHAGGTVPLWAPTTEPRPYAPLGGDGETDVVVIGAGLVGLMTSHHCKQAGLRVVVLEAGHVGSGESNRTTAHVTAQLDAGWKKIVGDIGAGLSRSLWTEAMVAIHTIESLVASLHVECGWKRVPGWRYAEDEHGLKDLRDEAEAAASAGIPLDSVPTAPLPWKVAGALRCAEQAELVPGPFLEALARSIEGDGSHVHEGTRALEIRDEDEPVVVTERGSVRAKHVVVATHAPFNNRVLLQTKIAHYRSYVVALHSPFEIPDGLYWDDADPYHYVRSTEHEGRRIVLVGGEDHRTGREEDTTARLAALESWALARLPGSTVVRRWSGQILEPVDGLPYVGRNALEKHVYEATGFSGTGWAYGALAARILADAIRGVVHPLAETLAATRITPIASAKRYIQENAAFPWHFFGDRLSSEATQIELLPRGQGKLFMARTLRKVAVYRDMDGELHALSPVCPHMGCIVDYNQAESSWDCPCHGSRFDVHGRVLNGPATQGLERVDAPAEKIGTSLERALPPEGT